MNVVNDIRERMHRATHMEVILEFGQWMTRRVHPAEVRYRDVMARFPVSYATAFRWINAWRAVNGMSPLIDCGPQHRLPKR